MALAGKEIREEFLRYFEKRGHRRVASGSLVPESDPTLMFANAGMVPFKRVFLGEESRPYSRATTSQKCMRVSGKHDDLEEVGRSPIHHTFFEMLGNFSFGDYFKREAIDYAWELLGNLGFVLDDLKVSVFREDDEAFDLWHDGIGLSEDRIYRLDENENFWSMGDTGPCGYNSEIHHDYGVNADCPREVCDPSCDCGRWTEVWNLVFMQFNRDAKGKREPLPKPSVDTGAGLERMASVLQGVRSNYDTDIFVPILARAQEVTGVELGRDEQKDFSLRVLSDHARSVSFLIGEGVLPSNAGRGYVLRRILRRAARHAVLLGVEEPVLYRVADAVIDEMADAYPELEERRAFILQRIRRDEERFLETLSKGLVLLENEVAELRAKGGAVLPGEVVFRLYDTFGFPVDLTNDILRGYQLSVDQPGFDAAMALQRERARAAWKGSGDVAIDKIYGRLAAELSTEFVGHDTLAGEARVVGLLVGGRPVETARAGDEAEIVVEQTPFYAEAGGQVGDRGVLTTDSGRFEIEDTQAPVQGLIVHRGRVSEGLIELDTGARLTVDEDARRSTVRNHSGTHLLHAALREVLGPQAMQKGSLVGPNRLRFDFTHDAPLTADELERIEDTSNEWIERNAPAHTRIMAYRDALAAGAIALFGEKYGDEVRVISFGDFSTELCGGTHAGATGEIGLVKILSESGIAAGIRRIEALTGMGALQHIRREERALRDTANLLKSPSAELPGRVERLLEERREAQREIEKLQASQRGGLAADLVAGAREITAGKALAVRVSGVDAKAMRTIVDDLRNRLGSSVVLLAAESDGKVLLSVGVTKDLTGAHKAGDLIREVAQLVGGGGGGRPDFAQAGGRDPSKIDAALEKFYSLVGVG